MKRSYDFEVRQFCRGKWKVISHFSDLRAACDFAYDLNVRTREKVIVVRVDYEPLGLFDCFPETIKDLNCYARNK